MSQTILGGNFTIYFQSENRQKRIDWTGAATGTNTAISFILPYKMPLMSLLLCQKAQSCRPRHLWNIP